jgi:WD40 repeat protein
MEGHVQGIGGIAFSPDDTVVATAAGDGNARLFSATDASYICALRGHRSWATSLAFSPDGQRLISGSDDKTIRIWGLST